MVGFRLKSINRKIVGLRSIDLTGQVFERLTVLEIAKKTPYYSSELFWLCLCTCGTKKIIRSGSLRSGVVKSCGCLRREATIERNKARAKQ